MMGGDLDVFSRYHSQRAARLGNVLAGLARRAIPLIAPVLKNVGKKLVTRGASHLNDVIQDRLGDGAPARKRKRPSKKRNTTRRPSLKPKKRSRKDIFST